MYRPGAVSLTISSAAAGSSAKRARGRERGEDIPLMTWGFSGKICPEPEVKGGPTVSSLAQRLEVRVSSQTLELLRREAARRRVPVAQLVREALELFLRREAAGRLAAAEALFGIEAPVCDWEQMEREIERARSVSP